MDDHWEDFIIHTKWEMLVMFMSEKFRAPDLRCCAKGLIKDRLQHITVALLVSLPIVFVTNNQHRATSSSLVQ